jgi:hypothetical protein
LPAANPVGRYRHRSGIKNSVTHNSFRETSRRKAATLHVENLSQIPRVARPSLPAANPVGSKVITLFLRLFLLVVDGFLWIARSRLVQTSFWYKELSHSQFFQRNIASKGGLPPLRPASLALGLPGSNFPREAWPPFDAMFL